MIYSKKFFCNFLHKIYSDVDSSVISDSEDNQKMVFALQGITIDADGQYHFVERKVQSIEELSQYLYDELHAATVCIGYERSVNRTIRAYSSHKPGNDDSLIANFLLYPIASGKIAAKDLLVS